MNSNDIPTLEIQPFMSPETSRMRQRAPKFLYSLFEQEVLQNAPQQIKSLSGGELSAVYLVKYTDESLVVKFGTHKLEDEAEWLSTWEKVGASVPMVKGIGETVSIGNGEITTYLIIEGTVDSGRNRSSKNDSCNISEANYTHF